MASHSSNFDDDDWDYLDEVANKAYLGSASDLLEMHLAMKDMGTYTFSGIHALVSPLEMGPEESGSSGEFAMDTPRGAANLALAFLGDFPALCPPDVKEEAVWRLQDAIPGMIRWIEKILLISPGVWPQGTRLELNDREFEELVKHDGIISTLIELCQFNKEWTRKDIASNPYIIDLAIFLWVATHKGDVILYPLSDSRSNDPEVNCEDTFTKFFFIVTDEPWIAKEVAKAIMAGRVCSPETFVERSIQRMKATVNIHGLKHLSRFPSNTAEHAVLSHTFLAIDGLMGSGNEALRDLFMEKQAPEQFMIVLSIFGTRYHTRLQKTLPAPVEKELKTSLLQVLFMTHKVVEWCFNSYPYGVAAIQSVVNKGAVKTLANCLMLGNDPDYLETIGNNSFIMLYDYLARCSVFPKIQLAVMEQMALCVTPELNTNNIRGFHGSQLMYNF
ncbi:hypothetical protein DFP72DRAFT_1065386 [Ephemerocybe angulata]|uniref:Uncharacterized protein n=1 Tax=Ephemerocybe angulata TaxID=980116 RepID=A0A8H6M6Z8_9AGAR|nr:hypothetical protein DFP72DRAFT_1065386 [Tulosesus angulatus]